MASYIIVVRLLLFVAAGVWCSAHADNYCCAPDQFEISLGQIQGLALPSGQSIAQLIGARIAGDFTNNRVGEEILVLTSGQATQIKLIIDYKKGVMYTIIGQTCIKTEARGEFTQCIPKTVHFDGSSFLGDNELTVDSYSHNEDIPKVFRGGVTISVTHSGCIPVSVSLVGEATQTDPPIPMVSGGGYSNFTRGIKDPGQWFDVPSICQKSQFRRSASDFDADTNAALQLVSVFGRMALSAFIRN